MMNNNSPTATPSPMLRVAFYARVSSEQQSQAGTIDSQVAMLRERIEQDGLSVEPAMGFMDDGYSGSTLVRPALEKLRDTAAAGAMDRLYVSCPDRLARKCGLQLLLVEELERCGVELVFLNRAIGHTPEDEMLLQMQGAVAEYERAKILERSRRGRLHAARRGSVSVFSTAPYGYRYVSKQQSGGDPQLNVHLEEARVVRQVFQWIGVDRLSLAEVCRRLEKQGVSAPDGGNRWDRSSLYGMVQNPAYRGSAAYGKRCWGPMRPRLRPRRGAAEQPRRPGGWYHVPQEKWIRVPVPALVEEELFSAVSEQMEENRRRARLGERGARFLLQGLVACGGCGYAYCGAWAGGSAQRSYGYYRCIGGNGHHRCTGGRICRNPMVRIDRLDEAVWRDVRSLLEDPRRVEAEFQRRLGAKDVAGGDPQRRRTAEAAAHARRGIARLIDAYRDGLLSKEEFEPRLSAARATLARLDTEVASQLQADAAAREMRLVIDNLQAFAGKVKAGLAQADWQTRRDLIRTLVKRVEIEEKQVRVVYKVDIRPFDQGPEKGLLQHCWRQAVARTANWVTSALFREKKR
jgi:site-specific DNA recombinase